MTPDFIGIVFDPAFFVDILLMGLGRLVADGPGLVEEQHFGALCALIDAENVRLHIKAAPWQL